MKTIYASMLGVCALISMSACSNSEPAIENGDNNVSKGDRVYLAVKINTPGAQGTRAAGDSYGYEYGSEKENEVATANFYFYDEEGKYAELKSNHWVNGGEGKDDVNIEYKSGGTIVLDGVKNKAYPKYVVTVLNQSEPDKFNVPATLADWAKLTDWNCKNSDGLYVMTTSSYLGNNAKTGASLTERTSALGSCYATELVPANFLQETPDKVQFKEEDRVQIYVERLASRVTVDINMTPADNGLYKTSMTVGGEENNDAITDLYVKFNGWTLFATANNSRPSKSLEGYTKDQTFETAGATPINWKWNDPDYYRSYWGKSIAWGLQGATLDGVLDNNGKYYTQLNTQFKHAMYCNENTNDYTKIIGIGNFADPNYATSVLVSATVCDKDGNGLDLVEYRGIKYLKKDFINYILNVLNLPYYTRQVKEEYKLQDGTTKTIYEYTQIKPDNVELKEAGDYVTGSITVKVLTDDNLKFYSLGDSVKETITLEDGTKKEITYRKAIIVDKDVINRAIDAKVHTGNTKAYAYTGGAMVYPIVIEHLNYALNGDGKKIAEKKITRDGQVGVVRNHAYTIKISKINTLGMGVYNPKSEEEGGELIKPEGPQDPTYYVESTINVLSWKLVEQDEEI